ncbi:GGDEF domain-containing protein [Ferrimonas aestuarii]|uniref:GGDEF domain-containing protein n=1 Tax=Ferrimonas aestuarii TaxID=2569539 RepID=A0A4V5NZ21_9GAMM|nr:GGDEF domain-containing protein [Ferrimonas aestuarii]TKB52768.1 GGDEF domain-containing protein [Ferrimonas aestuarii]
MICTSKWLKLYLVLVTFIPVLASGSEYDDSLVRKLYDYPASKALQIVYDRLLLAEPNSQEQCILIRAKAVTYFRLAQRTNALVSANDALRCAARLNDTRTYASAISVKMISLSHLDRELEAYETVLEYYRSRYLNLEDPLVNMVFMNLASMMVTMGDTSLAKEMATAVNKDVATESPMFRCQYYLGLASIASESNDIVGTETWVPKANEECIGIDSTNKSILLVTNSSLAKFNNDYEKARDLLEESMHHFESEDPSSERWYILREMLEIYYGLGEFEKVKWAADQLLSDFAHRNTFNFRSLALKYLAKVATDEKDYELAADYWRKHSFAQERYSFQQQQKLVAQHRIKMQSEFNIDLKQLVDKNQEREIDQNTRFAVLLVLMLTIIGVLYWLYRSRLSLLSKLRHVEQASKDPITMAPPKNRWMADCRQMMAPLDPSTPMAMVLVKVEQLHEINQEYGYEVGDQILTEVSTLLRRKIDDQMQLGRVSGSVFAICCGGISQQGAAEFAENLFAQTLAMQNPEQLNDALVISFGVSGHHKQLPINELLIKAETDLRRRRDQPFDLKEITQSVERAGREARKQQQQQQVEQWKQELEP